MATLLKLYKFLLHLGAPTLTHIDLLEKTLRRRACPSYAKNILQYSSVALVWFMYWCWETCQDLKILRDVKTLAGMGVNNLQNEKKQQQLNQDDGGFKERNIKQAAKRWLCPFVGLTSPSEKRMEL